MGNGKKNKKGGAPKQKGRLATALVVAQQAQAARAKAALAEEKRIERAKVVKALAAGGVKPKKVKADKGKAVEVADVEEEEEEAPELVDGTNAEPKSAKVKPAKSTRPKRLGTIPYGLNERILLVGEGNFSFAHSLLLFTPPQITPSLLLATSYDTMQAAQDKYPDLMEHVDAIKEAGGRVLFSVDAQALEKCKEVKEASASGGWDKVGFNFPHVGAGITDQDRNVRANQTLVLRFLRSVAPFLRVGPSAAPTISTKKRAAPVVGKRPPPTKRRVRKKADSSDEDEDDDNVEDLGSDPEDETVDLTQLHSAAKPAGAVVLTLRTHAPYSLWSISALATRGPLLAPSILPRPLPKGPQPTFVIRRSMEFNTSDYEGYEHRRTVGFKEGVSSGKNEDLTLTARERGLKKYVGKAEEPEVEDGEETVEGRKGKKGSMRSWEFELVPPQDADDAYD